MASSYAILMTFSLGNLCGLMPDMTPDSEQLHRVVELSSGIRDDEEREIKTLKQNSQTPAEKLKEALSSKKAFQKYYLVRDEIK